MCAPCGAIGAAISAIVTALFTVSLRFIHCSDIHLLELEGTRLRDFVGKRVTGGANLLLRRGRKHDEALFEAIAEQARAVDRLVITGDLTNLSLDSEFAYVRAKLDNVDVPVTVIPGNHDAYTRGAHRNRRFEHFFAHLMEGERLDGEDYPFVQRFDGVAFVGVSTAVATLPLYATGTVGEAQLARLDRQLEALRAEGLDRVVLIHHPVTPGASKKRHDLLDLDAFGEVIAKRGAELILHGHEHEMIEATLPGPEGSVPVHGIASGTSISEREGRRGAFSLYEISDDRIDRKCFVWDGEAFRCLEEG